MGEKEKIKKRQQGEEADMWRRQTGGGEGGRRGRGQSLMVAYHGRSEERGKKRIKEAERGGDRE